METLGFTSQVPLDLRQIDRPQEHKTSYQIHKYINHQHNAFVHTQLTTLTRFGYYLQGVLLYAKKHIALVHSFVS